MHLLYLIRIILSVAIICISSIPNIFAEIDSDSLFPVSLSFELVNSQKALKVNISNSSKEVLIVDWKAIKSIQLVYWFMAEGHLICSGYETSMKEDLNAQTFSQLPLGDKGGFVKLSPGEKLEHSIPLRVVLEAVRPLISKIADDSFVGLQIYGDGLSVARIMDKKIVFDDHLYRAISIGKPLAINKQDLIRLLQ
jgi:hypothetical protein